jgi:hypothetical protein
LDRLTQLQQKTQKQELIKMMTTSANVAFKESQDTMKKFIKSDSNDISTFSKQFITQRAVYYKSQAIKEMISQA